MLRSMLSKMGIKGRAAYGESRERELAGSTDMVPVEGTVEVEVPAEKLWEAFTRANLWPRWNECMLWVGNRDLVKGRNLLWAFRPIRRWYPYVLPATAKIVEVEDGRRVTWEVTALPGFYARHSYSMKDLGGGHTRFGSWEKAMGPTFRLTKRFWIPHFVFVKDRSLEGARTLEEIYRREGSLEGRAITRSHRRFPAKLLLLLLPAVAAGAGVWWFYVSYVRQSVVNLAPGVYAVLGGGGNSLVVESDGEVLLMDPKFAPASKWLRDWISSNIGAPVTKIVNTHYHYDHTEGNVLYPGAKIFAHEDVPALMLSRENDFNSTGWWRDNPRGVPGEKLGEGEHRITVGEKQVVLSHPGRAHTGGDLVLRLPEHNVVATGDLAFCGYYPFLDVGEGGASFPQVISAIRALADEHPDAVFLPGHGPIARADDLRRHADYLESLYEGVRRSREEGLSERATARGTDLSEWKLSVLPSLHAGKLTWATARNNARWVYRLLNTDEEDGRHAG